MAGSFIVWLFAVSVAASALGGMLGMASGIFIVPLLTMFGHVEIHTAIGASIISVIPCSCGGAAPYLKNRLTNIRLAIVLETATTVGALTGVLLAGIVPVPYLYLLFAVILFLSAHQMLAGAVIRFLSPRTKRHAFGEIHCAWTRLIRIERLVAMSRCLISCASRTLRHAAHVWRRPDFSVIRYRSGVLKIPAMDTAMRLPLKVSSATSNFMIGVTAAASAGVYFMRGNIVTEIAGPVAFGSVLGAIMGARILLIVPNDKLRLLFAAILVVLGVQMLLTLFGVHLIKGSL
jgi:uncharacterized membrane protein YfcA